MDKIVEVVKQHPVPVGIGVVVILLLVMSRGSSAASSGSNAGAYLQAQTIAANSNAQMASLNSQTSIALGAQSVEKTGIAEQNATQRMGVAASLFSTLAGVNAQVSMNNSNNSAKTVVAAFQNSQNMATINNDFAIQQQTIAANIKMNGDKLQTQKDMLESDNNFKLLQIGATTQGDIDKIAAVSAAQLDSQDKQNAFTLTTLPSILQHQETMAKITGQNAVNIAQINTEAARTTAQAGKNQSDWGIVGNIASSLFSLF